MHAVNIRYATVTDVGVKRSHNQDACVSQPAADDEHFQSHGHVFLVADGMGGHAVGEKASAKAVGVIPLTYLKHVAQDGVPAAITRAFQEANSEIYQIGQNNPEFHGLGTTGTAIILRPEGAWVGHVGDSRAYRVRDHRVQQLTYDHSFAWELARRQGVDPEAFGDFKRNVITRSLGPAAEVEVDIEGPYPLRAGDRFLICSDGLTNEVTPEEIGAVLLAFAPEEATRMLIDLANARGGKDNVTCLVVMVPEDATGLLRTASSGVMRALRRRTGRAWRLVPWPFAMLAAGALFAGLSVALNVNSRRGLAIPAFLLATATILAGLVGVYWQMKRRGAPVAREGSGDGTLHYYREHPVVYSADLVARLAHLDEELRAALAVLDAPIDWAGYEELARSAQAALARNDPAAAFCHQMRATQLLAGALHRTRNKGEGFSPNYR